MIKLLLNIIFPFLSLSESFIMHLIVNQKKEEGERKERRYT